MASIRRSECLSRNRARSRCARPFGRMKSKMRRFCFMTSAAPPNCWRARRSGRSTASEPAHGRASLTEPARSRLSMGWLRSSRWRLVFSEDLVRAWYILTEQSVVTHLLAIPVECSRRGCGDCADACLTDAAAAGYAARREVRRALQEDSSVEGDRLVEFLAGLRYELDADDRGSAYSLIARGSGGTDFR